MGGRLNLIGAGQLQLLVSSCSDVVSLVVIDWKLLFEIGFIADVEVKPENKLLPFAKGVLDSERSGEEASLLAALNPLGVFGLYFSACDLARASASESFCAAAAMAA